MFVKFLLNSLTVLADLNLVLQRSGLLSTQQHHSITSYFCKWDPAEPGEFYANVGQKGQLFYVKVATSIKQSLVSKITQHCMEQSMSNLQVNSDTREMLYP